MKRLIAPLAIAFAVTAALAGVAVAQQTGVTQGAFCAPEGATGTTSAGTAMVCGRAAGETQPRWQAASGTVTSPTGTVTAIQTATPNTGTGIPNTGVLSVRVGAFGVLLVALGWLFVSAVRPARRQQAAVPESVFGAWTSPRFEDRRQG